MLSRLLVSLVIGCFLVPSVDAQDSPQLDRFKLLQFQKSANEVAPVETAAQWSIRREAILLAMQQVMGKYPDTKERLDPSIEVVEEADAGTFIRRLITYQSEAEPGADGRTPAYLCIPKDVLAGKRKAAAVLCLHPTDNTVGHKVVVGLGGRAGRQYASELA